MELSECRLGDVYSARAQDGPQEMERNLAGARHSWARQHAWLLLSFFPFLVGHPVAAHGRVASISFSGHFLKGHPVSSWLLLCILVLWSSYPIGRKEGRKESHKKDPKSVLVATALHPEIGNSTFISSDKKREGEVQCGASRHS